MISKFIALKSRALLLLKGSCSGQSLVEYALVLSFISLLSVVFMSIFAVHLRGVFMAILSALAAARSVI